MLACASIAKINVENKEYSRIYTVIASTGQNLCLYNHFSFSSLRHGAFDLDAITTLDDVLDVRVAILVVRLPSCAFLIARSGIIVKLALVPSQVRRGS
jgi:hypothetical protein